LGYGNAPKPEEDCANAAIRTQCSGERTSFNQHETGCRLIKGLTFEWHPVKAEANESKHGVSFAEAATIFRDPLARLVDDPEHSEDEPRYILFGESARGRLLVGMHTERAGRIRLISAREMTRRERTQYERYRAES
jgi:uncharacterized protein